MLPVIFSIGPVAISSFGLFLALSFLYGTFLVWRLARAWDLDAEKVLDLTLLTFFGGLFGSRLYFILQHIDFFGFDLIKMVAITKYPGFSFWGAFLGGWLTLYFFVRKFKLDFWQMADIGAIGFLGGMILGNIGCFLGGCSIGIESNFPIAVKMVGVIGKRFPIQVFESLAYIGILYYLWPKAIHFHIPGKIVSLVLIYVGITKFVTEFFKIQTMGGHFFALILVFLGLGIMHKINKRTMKEELKFISKSLSKVKDKILMSKQLNNNR